MSSGGDPRRRFEVDDHESYGRPSRRSRARTKRRPRHEDASIGVVVAIDRGRYSCVVDGVVVTAMRSRPLGRRRIVVGDRVRLVGDVSGTEGTLARIVTVDERATELRRTADDDDPVERVIVANADQMVIVVSLADPPPRPRLIDRCLVAAYDAEVDPLLCLTKADLAAPDALLATYRPLGVPSVATRYEQEPDELRYRLADRVSVLVGHSGVGKSTLVNALVPGADRSTAEVSEATGRGRHTSTQVRMLDLPSGGSIVDTPGIRSFGLAHVRPETIVAAFGDLDAVVDECPRRCTHDDNELECALDSAVAEGRISAERVESFRRLLGTVEAMD